MDEQNIKGTSMEPPALADVYLQMAARATEEAIRIGVEIGTATAERRLNEAREERSKGRYKRRLHNTRLLLANYRKLKDHVSGAVFTGKQAKETAVEILDGLDSYEFEDRYYINAIKQSQQRTMIILAHIDEMMKLYRISCEQSGKPEEERRYRVIYAAYIDPERPNPAETAAENGIDESTYYRDIRDALKPLSALLFGIDGIHLG